MGSIEHERCCWAAGGPVVRGLCCVRNNRNLVPMTSWMYGAARDPRLSHASKLSHGKKLTHLKKLDSGPRLGLKVARRPGLSSGLKLDHDTGYGAMSQGQQRVAQYDAHIKAALARGDMPRARGLIAERNKIALRLQRRASAAKASAGERARRSYDALVRWVRGSMPKQRVQLMMGEDNQPVGLVVGGDYPERSFAGLGARALMIASLNDQRVMFWPYGTNELAVAFLSE